MLKYLTNDVDYGIEAVNHPLPKGAEEKVGVVFIVFAKEMS